jgi:hypothetical protein
MYGSEYPVDSSSVLWVPNGATVYLTGTLTNPPTFSYTMTTPTPQAGQFYVPIMSNAAAAPRQLQYGNVVEPGAGGGGGEGGGIPFPQYHNLTYHTGGEGDEYTGGTDISDGNAYLSTSPGWVRVSIKNEGGNSGCVRLVIGGSSIGLVRLTGDMTGGTWLFPIPANTSFRVSNETGSSIFARFDGDAQQV